MSQILMLAGDVNLQGRTDPASAFQHVRDLLATADVRFVNLEGVLCGPGQDPQTPDIAHKPNWRHSAPEMVEGLAAAGIDAVSVANNVTFPPKAMLTGLSTLDSAGIAHCGAGADLSAAHRPVVSERDGVRFGFLAYTAICWPFGMAAGPQTPGVATLRASTSYVPDLRSAEVPGRPPRVLTEPYPHELAAMVRDVEALRTGCDVLVLSCHWGVAGDEVCDYQRTIGRAAIDAGADLVMGHGPHSVQGIELHRGRPIFYSLGNFVFDWPAMAGRHLDGLVLHCGIEDRRLRSVQVHPVRRGEDNDVRPLSGDDARAALSRLTTLSAPLSSPKDVLGLLDSEGLLTLG
ncbi:CapA family protein [Catenulispora sp. NF23]|uniref:CapA family protein n=1 Tax=Catenulispora pinistramenti TaxID=2705254 RepID=UPI001BAD0EDE|nr:CapA family protein [Catenulispora pinistramenti]MBS2536651.1 CapA family protein [Catenulispora pinistramenti]